MAGDATPVNKNADNATDAINFFFMIYPLQKIYKFNLLFPRRKIIIKSSRQPVKDSGITVQVLKDSLTSLTRLQHPLSHIGNYRSPYCYNYPLPPVISVLNHNHQILSTLR